MVSPSDPISQRLAELKALLGPLPQAGLPFALLPVGLETRFVTTNGVRELLVRIRPDNLWVDSHEPGLEAGEITWGQQYWETVWRAGEDQPVRDAAWDRLVNRFGRVRAAWIVRLLAPENLGDRPQAAVPEGTEPPVRPLFPDPATRSETWEAPAVLASLPERWVLFGYQGGRRVFVHWSEPVLGPLAVSPEPGRPEDEPLPEGAGEDQLALDPGLRWLVDFDEALRVGMALRVPLPPVLSASPAYDLLCLGLQLSGDGASQLEALLTAQRFTDGLAFVPPATPTNNAPGQDSGYDSGRELAAPVVAAGEELPPGSNGAQAASALGLPPAVFAGVPHAAAQEDLAARSLNAVLWPAAGRYFLEGLLRGPGLGERFPAAERHFVEHVRAGGPLPLLRVGRQPYGLLPVVSLERLPAASPGEEQFLSALRSLRALWRQALPKVPQALPGENPEQAEADLLEILRMESSSVRYSTRLIFDRSVFGASGVPLSISSLPAGVIARARFIQERLRASGLELQPRLLDALPASQVAPLSAPLVQAGAADRALEPDYLSWLSRSTFEEILAEDLSSLPGAPQQINNLLYLVARHAVLLAYALAAHRILVSEGLVPEGPFPEPVLIDVQGGEQPERTTTLLRLMEMVVPGLGSEPLGRIIHTLGEAHHPQAAGLDALRRALVVLSARPAGELDRLLRGGLDLFSYRLDGWITSLATRRLAQLRSAGQAGVALGAYGWVEGLRPAPRQPVAQVPDGEAGSALFADPASGGFVHTPSLAQAAAAAILRSGFLSEVSEDNGQHPLAVDLSSGRVRLARFLLDGIRQGQPLAVLLGYRFERGLHERKLDRYIAPLRRLAPFSELDKARVRLEDAQAEVARLRTLPHPQLAAAQARVDEMSRKVKQLINERNQLPAQIQTTQSRIAAFDQQITAIRAEIRRLQNLIQHSGNPALEARLEAQVELLANRQASRQSVVALLARLQSRSGSIGAEITLANQNLQTAEAQARALSGLVHPGLAAAEEALSAAQQAHDRLLSEYRQRFLFPSGAGIQALESVAAHSVVDGLALLELWKNGDFPFAKVRPDLPAADRAGLEAELRALEAAVDAVSDALTAESVYQLVQGNPNRAGASLDAVVQGDLNPPELEVVNTPRSGVGLTHRLLVLFGPAPAAEAADWPANDRQVRAAAEPRLNSWAARLLGSPEKVRASLEFLDPAEETVLSRRVVRLKSLGLAPLDIVYLAAGSPEPEGSELERLLLYFGLRNVPDGLPPGVTARLRYERHSNWAEDELSFGELLETASALGKLILGARPAFEADLAIPGRRPAPGLDLDEIKGRADRAVSSLATASRRLVNQMKAVEDAAGSEGLGEQLERLRGLLLRFVQLGLPGAVPVSPRESDAGAAKLLLEQAARVAKSAAQRIEELRLLDAGFEAGPGGEEAARDQPFKRLEAALGSGFRALPVLLPGSAGQVAAALNSSDALQGGQPHQAAAWFRRAARVRAGAGRLSAVLTYAAALGRPGALDLSVGQLPFQPGDRWAALPVPAGQPFPAGITSLVAHLPHGFDPNAPLAGLMVDEWVEVAPSPTSQTGVAFNVDAPGARPPQAILLAVSPPAGSNGDGANWDLETLESTLLETQELARLRAVDPDALSGVQELPHFLPALYFGLNLAGDTVSTDFRRAA